MWGAGAKNEDQPSRSVRAERGEGSREREAICPPLASNPTTGSFHRIRPATPNTTATSYGRPGRWKGEGSGTGAGHVRWVQVRCAVILHMNYPQSRRGKSISNNTIWICPGPLCLGCLISPLSAPHLLWMGFQAPMCSIHSSHVHPHPIYLRLGKRLNLCPGHHA